MTHPPLIGITTRSGEPAWVQKNSRNYLDIVSAFGAAPVILSPDRPAVLPNGTLYEPDSTGRLAPEVLHHLAGLILSGGGDVDPVRFGAPLAGAEIESIDPKRDELEIVLARAALGRDLPLFGICRGCQVLNVAAGGGMIQHLDGHRSPETGTSYHAVVVESGSLLFERVGSHCFAVNTFHHQGMDRAALAPLFRPAAAAEPPDAWLVEAYESPAHTWVVGVQWHPERLFELSEEHRRLWEDFFAACQAAA